MSLKDQMLKAGLINQKQAGNAAKKKKKARDLAKDVKADIAAKRAAELEKSKALNEAQQAAKREKEIQAQIRQMISANAVSYQGDEKYNFVHDSKVKTLYVEPLIRRSLLNGQLLVVVADDTFSIIPSGAAEKIAQRAPEMIIANTQETATEPDDDDPYKDFVVPDDLMW